MVYAHFQMIEVELVDVKSTNLMDISKQLEAFDINQLDGLEEWHYNHHIKSMSKVEALQVIINTVEGDYSQLSSELAELAELQQPQVFYTS